MTLFTTLWCFIAERLFKLANTGSLIIGWSGVSPDKTFVTGHAADDAGGRRSRGISFIRCLLQGSCLTYRCWC